MIITLTMNPAIDKTVTIDAFGVDKVNRIGKSRLDAAGKGINVSKVVRELGGRTKTIAFLGGASGDFIKAALEKERITLLDVKVDGETRTNIKIVDPSNNTYTDINDSGSMVGPEQLQVFEKKLMNYVTSQSVVVFTGSVPPGISKDIYKKYIERVQSIGATAVLDADGDLLRHGILAGPKIIKPNIHELENFAGRELKTIDEMIEIAKTFINHGTELVALSLGADGALFIRSDKVIKAKGLNVDVKGTVGAGDAMLGAICYGVHKDLPFEEIVRLAIGASAAKVCMEGTQPPSLSHVYELSRKVKFEEI